MSNGRSATKKTGNGRDSGGFIALPWSVVDSPAYLALSMHARALMLEVARQYVRDNNGRLLLSKARLAERGWKSSDMLNKAKAELLAGGFIFETVKGHRPNKASWYALTWHALDRHPAYDPDAAIKFAEVRAARSLPKKSAAPPHGPSTPAIGPPHGPETLAPSPHHGPMQHQNAPRSGPPHGHHLDMPSPIG